MAALGDADLEVSGDDEADADIDVTTVDTDDALIVRFVNKDQWHQTRLICKTRD